MYKLVKSSDNTTQNNIKQFSLIQSHICLKTMLHPIGNKSPHIKFTFVNLA